MATRPHGVMRPFAFLKKFVWILGHLSLVMFLLLLIFIMLAMALYFAEHGQHFANSPHSYKDSFYLSAVTALTIGYGDFVPHTTLGRWISLLLALTGITFTGIIAAAAVKALEMQMREREHSENE